MSATFYTMDRRHLIDIVKSVVDEDEHRLIQFLVSGTVIDKRINGTSASKPFTSNVGTPQEDNLNSILFITYLEHALKVVRPIMPRPTSSFEALITNEVTYGVDTIGQKYAYKIKKIQEVLKKYQLKVNTDKTGYNLKNRRRVDRS